MYAHVHSARGYFSKDSRGKKYFVNFEITSAEIKKTDQSIIFSGHNNGKKFEITIEPNDISKIIDCSIENDFISQKDFQNIFQRKKHLDILKNKISELKKQNSEILDLINDTIKLTEKINEI